MATRASAARGGGLTSAGGDMPTDESAANDSDANDLAPSSLSLSAVGAAASRATSRSSSAAGAAGRDYESASMSVESISAPRGAGLAPLLTTDSLNSCNSLRIRTQIRFVKFSFSL